MERTEIEKAIRDVMEDWEKDDIKDLFEGYSCEDFALFILELNDRGKIPFSADWGEDFFQVGVNAQIGKEYVWIVFESNDVTPTNNIDGLIEWIMQMGERATKIQEAIDSIPAV